MKQDTYTIPNTTRCTTCKGEGYIYDDGIRIRGTLSNVKHPCPSCDGSGKVLVTKTEGKR